MTQPEPGTLGTDRSMGTNTIGVAQTAITALQKIIETFHRAADMVLQAIHDLLPTDPRLLRRPQTRELAPVLG